MHKLGANIEKKVFLILSSGYGGGLDSINASPQAISEYAQWPVSGEWPCEVKGLALPRYIVLFPGKKRESKTRLPGSLVFKLSG